MDSLLIAADTVGRLHCFLDGSYPIGAVMLDPSCEAKLLTKIGAESNKFKVHVQFHSEDRHSFTNLMAFPIEIPLLDTKLVRQVAESSSAARELVWYIIRVIKEMKSAWFGGDGLDGAREMNANYVRGLEDRQTQFARKLYLSYIIHRSA